MKPSIRRPLVVVALSVLVTVPLHVERPPAASATGGATIQSLVEGASAGGTVIVPPGTYIEDLAIGKALTLQCANAGVSAGATPGTRGPESTIQGQAVVTASGVIIDGCRFVRPAVASSDVPRLVMSEGVTGQVVIRNSVFDLTDAAATTRASRGCGAGVSGTAAWRVSDSQFRNQFYDQFSDACGSSGQRYGSRMIFAENAQPVIVEGNRFESVSQSVFLTGTQPSGSEILNNVFTASSALFMGTPSDVLIRGNTFDGGGALYLAGSTDTIIENNLLTAASTYLVYSVDSGAFVTTGTVVRNNAILGKYTFGGASFEGFGMFNLGAGAMDATSNWWGVSTEEEVGAVIRQVGTVTFEPWLTSDEDVGNPSDVYTTGFWPPLPVRLAPPEQQSTPGPIPVDGSLPAPEVGEAVWQLDDGSTVVLEVSSPAPGQIRYEADGVQLTLAGSPGTSASGGLVVDATGAFTCEICGTFAVGSVIEVWMFSEPRLVAAWQVVDLPCQTITVPIGAPLDGGGPVPVGAHTLQLVLPTASGVQAVNVGVTVGGPVPTSVPAGGSPSVPLWLLSIALLGVLLLGGDLIRRMARVTSPA